MPVEVAPQPSYIQQDVSCLGQHLLIVRRSCHTKGDVWKTAFRERAKNPLFLAKKSQEVIASFSSQGPGEKELFQARGVSLSSSMRVLKDIP